MRTTNTKSRHFVENKVAFTANNLCGMWKHNYYVVYSYNWWPLFAYSEAKGVWYENIDKYSVSTSKQRTQCHPLVDTISVSKDELVNIILGGN